MNEIEQKLDQLAEFQSQKDSVHAHKQAMLDELKVPADVQAVLSDSRARIMKIESDKYQAEKIIIEQLDKEYALIAIPDEVKAILDEISKQRDELQRRYAIQQQSLYDRMTAEKRRIDAETDEKVKDVFDQLNKRKQEIEIEFAGKSNAVDENIEALKREIEADVLKRGESVKGKYYHAVWNKGRVGTWNSGKLDGLALIMPAIAECRNPGGEPTVTFRSVK
jgi:hypothetical protein